MSDHYSILGLSRTATTAEIKTAYRRLVKLYHPDKNPNNPSAVEKFRLIQEAYDTLSDNVKRTKYDNKINYAYSYSYGETVQTQTQTKQRTKRYTFTDEDLKRRQYYKEHYKQSPKQKAADTPAQKKAFNEVKYILLSVPIAMALLFFIINIYKREKSGEEKTAAPYTKNSTEVSVPVDSNVRKTPVEVIRTARTADEPYNYLFGEPGVDKRMEQVLQVTNWSGKDAVVCVVNAKTNKVVRNYFVGNNYNILFEYLPEGTYYLRNYVGKDFRFAGKYESSDDITGTFESEQQFQSFAKDTFSISLSRHDTIVRDIAFIQNANSKNISDGKTFFGR
jgi:curved DNA-binding protein CbpA